MGIFFLILFPCLTHISRRLLALGKNAKFCSEACKGLGPRPAGCAAQRTPLSGHLDPGRRHWVPLLVSRTGGVSLLDDLQGKCLWGRHGGSQQSPHPGTTAGGGGGAAVCSTLCLFPPHTSQMARPQESGGVHDPEQPWVGGQRVLSPGAQLATAPELRRGPQAPHGTPIPGGREGTL